MVIDQLATGTLVVGFHRRPDQPLLDKTQQILREWAREDAPKSAAQRSSLIDFLRKNLSLADHSLKIQIGGH